MTFPGEIHYKSKLIPRHDLMDHEIVPLRLAVPQPAVNGEWMQSFIWRVPDRNIFQFPPYSFNVHFKMHTQKDLIFNSFINCKHFTLWYLDILQTLSVNRSYFKAYSRYSLVQNFRSLTSSPNECQYFLPFE